MSKTASFGTTSREGHDSSAFYNRKMYSHTRKQQKPLSPKGNGRAAVKKNFRKNVFHHHDSTNMHHLPDDSVHLMITSPPYNVGKSYDNDLTLPEYKALLLKVMKETERVLVDGGRMCINIANVGRSPYLPLHTSVIEIAEELNLLMRGEIIWDKGASAGQSCAWGSWRSASNPTLRDVHEYILIFSKKSYRRQTPGEDTISGDDFMQNTKSIWRFGAESARKIGHPAPFPVELPLRLIALYSFAGDIVLDPFMGSGTTAVAAYKTGRKYIGYEIEKKFITIAKQRMTMDCKQKNVNLRKPRSVGTISQATTASGKGL